MLRLTAAVHAALLSRPPLAWLHQRSQHRAAGAGRRPLGEVGQATAEYALVLLGAAAIALLLVAWATRSGKIGELLDAVIDQVIGRAGG